MIALFNVSSVFGASFLALITPKFMALWACMNPRFLMIMTIDGNHCGGGFIFCILENLPLK
jgi:hypothetical protein